MSFSRFGYLRVAACVPDLDVAAVGRNLSQTKIALAEAAKAGAQIAVFPELGLTAYSCGDLFYQETLLNEAWGALGALSKECLSHGIAAVVGLPVRHEGRIFNVAAVIDAKGRVAGLVPKTHLPNTGEFYEARWFESGRNVQPGAEIVRNGQRIPFGTDILFKTEGWESCVLGVELCEDLWAVVPPSCQQALAGANVLLNLSASNELLGKSTYRRDLVRQQSARCLAAYVYVSAGPGESTTDVVYSGHAMIAENGTLLAEGARMKLQTQVIVADLDVERLDHERTRNSSFRGESSRKDFRKVSIALSPWRHAPALQRMVDPQPFVPFNPQRRSEHCEEIFQIQATGLAKRLRHTQSKAVVVGISGGLDSTLAVLVAIRSFAMLGLPAKGIVAVSMPGLGTTDRTRDNSQELAHQLGITLRIISIHKAIQQHFSDIGHAESLHDITFENSQARERTQILMDIANQVGGFVLGTGDLSELALGWCTYNGDHMSMYHVNGGVPKTLVRHLVQWAGDVVFAGPVSTILRDICASPVSPELLPPGKDGAVQKTEDSVGPYLLHDFFLFQAVRNGFSPEKTAMLATIAFAGKYQEKAIARWLKVFYQRFFAQQFKRSAMPDGPKVGSVALSPRGDWRMPSDALPEVWLRYFEKMNKVKHAQ